MPLGVKLALKDLRARQALDLKFINTQVKRERNHLGTNVGPSARSVLLQLQKIRALRCPEHHRWLQHGAMAA